jgi:hypothetical protein
MDKLTQITNLARQQIATEFEIEQHEAKLVELKEKLKQLQEVDLPLAMAEADVSNVVLADGRKLTIKNEVYASIPKDKTRDAFRWLNDHGFGDIIKGDVKITFGRGQEEMARGLFDELDHRGLHPLLNQTVHPSTLKAFVKEQLEKGTNIPLELFGATPVTKVVIK